MIILVEKFHTYLYNERRIGVKMNKSEKKWVLLIFILAGLVIGGLFGKLAENNKSLWWLNYGMNFGLPNTLKLDLTVLILEFGFMVKITIANIIGILIGLLAYKYMR